MTLRRGPASRLLALALGPRGVGLVGWVLAAVVALGLPGAGRGETTTLAAAAVVMLVAALAEASWGYRLSGSTLHSGPFALPLRRLHLPEGATARHGDVPWGSDALTGVVVHLPPCPRTGDRAQVSLRTSCYLGHRRRQDWVTTLSAGSASPGNVSAPAPTAS